jgi:hypothetical protein
MLSIVMKTAGTLWTGEGRKMEGGRERKMMYVVGSDEQKRDIGVLFYLEGVMMG